MRMRALVLDAHTLEAITAADARAKAKPIPWAVIQEIALFNEQAHITLADRRDGKRPPSEQVEIQLGYRAAISYEMQPAGLIKHLSISVNEPGALPNPFAVKEIAKAFGIDEPDSAWLEEFDPGHECINLVAIVGPSDVPKGHA